MKLFKSLTLKWWQGSILNIGVLSLGIAIGATRQELFAGGTAILVALFLILAGYITIVWWKQ